jgi:hypothetical protein
MQIDRWYLQLTVNSCFCLLAAACATGEQIQESRAGLEYRISCGYFGWYMCYDRAQQICPGRYKVLGENEGMRGRELRIACPS